MSEKEETGKAYKLILSEAINLSGSFTVSQATIQATGSLATYDYYFREASRIADSASKAGSMTAADFEGIQKNLSEWYNWSEKWSSRISEGLFRNSQEEILTVDKEISEKISDQKEMITAIYKTVVGTRWKKIDDFFNVKSSSQEETTVFKDMKHSDILTLLLKWLENKNGATKLFASIIHGLGEEGVDIIVETCEECPERFGIQLKNNNDVKDKDFPTKIKAQITDSKKHKIVGLLIIFAADLTDATIRDRIRGLISDLSQMSDTFVKVFSPEKALTIMREEM